MNRKIKNIISIMFCIIMVITGISVFHVADNEFHADTTNYYGYFVEADSQEVVGAEKSTSIGGESMKGFTNTSPDNNHYVKYSNAVKAENGDMYDLIVYPFKKTKDAYITISKNFKVYHPSGNDNSSGFKIIITEHDNINKPISMNVLIGLADLDTNEGGSFPNKNLKTIHKGKNIEQTTDDDNYIKYTGIALSPNDSNAHIYDYNCVILNINIPKEGMTFYYFSKSGAIGMPLTFKKLLDYWGDDIIPDNNEYKISFNANGGSGSVPSTITKEGADSSVVMGDISSTIPTKSGYIFKGWSASPSWNSNRIAYSLNFGGSAASDGTSARITSGSWTYSDYCNYTGGSTSNDTLTLYAQWERIYSHTLSYNANGGTGAPSSSTVTNPSSTYSMTVSSTVPTRTGYTFTEWNTKADGTGTNYSAGSSVNVGADSTVTLYAQWRLNNYNVTYIDVNKDSGEELNRQIIQKPYNSTVKGIDIGSSTADNAYYNNYALISGADGYTTSVVNENGTTVVYRYFKWLTTDIKGTVSWNDNSNKYQTRPDTVTVRLYRDGVEIDSVTVNTGNNVNTYSFADLPKYDPETGRAYVYTVSQDTAYSQAALDTTEDKYTTTQDGYNFLNTISNTNKPDDPDDPDDKGFYVSGNIYWNDKDDKLGFRPSEVTITLYQKGEDGEWKPFREPVIVDSKNENHYLFDWLPKYWYDASGTPNAFEYKVEESFSAWYVKDGEMVDAYTITPDNPNEFDFTNTLHIVNPDIPFSEYTNTLVIKTNTEEEVRVILKPQKPIFDEDLNVTYGDYSGNDVTVFTDNAGTVVDKLSPTRYEIVIDSTEYTLDDIKLSLPQNVELENIGGKWYVTIGNQPEDAMGTLEIELTKKEDFYQNSVKANNYFKAGGRAKDAPVIKKMSRFITKPEAPVTVEYMDSLTTDVTLYSSGEQAEILDFLGVIPINTEFIGWSTVKESKTAEYLTGDMVTVDSENIVLYPVFKGNRIVEEEAETDSSKQLEEPVIIETVD